MWPLHNHVLFAAMRGYRTGLEPGSAICISKFINVNELCQFDSSQTPEIQVQRQQNPFA
jgi:hypothetical protein